MAAGQEQMCAARAWAVPLMFRRVGIWQRRDHTTSETPTPPGRREQPVGKKEKRKEEGKKASIPLDGCCASRFRPKIRFLEVGGDDVCGGEMQQIQGSFCGLSAAEPCGHGQKAPIQCSSAQEQPVVKGG